MDLIKEIKKLNTYYVNSNITNNNFPEPKEIRTGNWKVIKMTKSFSSQEALDEIKKQGCRPANIYELVSLAPQLEKGKSYIAFGSKYIDSDGDRGVPYVHTRADGVFKFDLGRFEVDFDDGGCLLCLCDSTLTPSTSSSETLDPYCSCPRCENCKKLIK